MSNWRWAARFGGIAGCAALLAACGGPRGVDVAGPAGPPNGAAVAPAPDAPPSPSQLAAVAPAAGGRPAAPELLGLSRADLSRLLGQPTLLRREPPGEVWQYAGRACVLHVFLYAEPSGSRVAHYEAVQRAGRGLTARDCYDRLLAEPRSAGAS